MIIDFGVIGKNEKKEEPGAKLQTVTTRVC